MKIIRTSRRRDCLARVGVFLIMAALIAGMVGCNGGSAEEPVYFPDANLRAVIREAIARPTGDIYPSDLAELTSLDGSSRNISDVIGLEHCTSLTYLRLEKNQISNISPLANLTSLTSLHLDSNQISYISPLTNLASLWYLTLSDNQISNIAPLTNLTCLLFLRLESNNISDISPLANLAHLEYLYLSDNQISDISDAANLTSLWYLALDSNQISDIAPLVENEGLGDGDKVYLTENPLSDDSVNIYIPQLEARGVHVVY
jgi:Leucine-rich repeat (LRR) protein